MGSTTFRSLRAASVRGTSSKRSKPSQLPKRVAARKRGTTVAALKRVRHPVRAVRPVRAASPRQAPTETTRMGPAEAGDHHGVHQFLTAVFHGPSRDAFLSSLDDPFYEPCDRLLVKSGDIILSHAHLTKRAMHFNGATLPVAGLNWVGTLPEFRGQGHASDLIRLAEQRMIEDGAVAGLLRTNIPHFFRREGWAVCGRHSRSKAGAREVIAQLSKASAALDPTIAGLSIRPWRQVELPALMRLYARNMGPRAGGIVRTEAYWRWVISCKTYDHIFVAIHGPDRWELEDTHSPIVGYVVTREDEILELITDPAHPRAVTGLVARACGEAIEQDLTSVTFHGAVDHPVHDLFRVAGGSQHHHEAHQGEVFMVKLFNPGEFLRAMCEELHRRAEVAQLPRPCELGLRVEGRKMALAISRRSAKVLRNKLGRSYLDCNIADFTRLVLGHLDVDEAVAAGRLEASTRTAQQIAQALFPRFPLWRSPLDDPMG